MGSPVLHELAAARMQNVYARSSSSVFFVRCPALTITAYANILSLVWIPFQGVAQHFDNLCREAANLCKSD
jgi:hypothetical protein